MLDYGVPWDSDPTQQALATQLNGFLGTIVNSAYADG